MNGERLILIAGFFALVAWCAFLVWYFLGFAGIAFADDEDLFGENNAQYGRFDKYNRPLLELRRTGVHGWEYVQEGRTNIRDVIAESLDDYGREFGIGHVEGVGGWKEIASGGMAFVYGNSLHGPCGSGAIGCLPDYLTAKQAIVYDADTMASWPRSSKKEGVNHEEGHHIANFAEGYIHQGGQIKCAPLDTPQHRSFMNCGLTNNQVIDDYIRRIWAKSHYPPKLAGAWWGWNGQWFAYSCKFSENTTRVAVLVDDGSGVRWAGLTKPLSVDSNGCMGVGPLDGLNWIIGARYYLLPENALSAFRNPIEVEVR